MNEDPVARNFFALLLIAAGLPTVTARPRLKPRRIAAPPVVCVANPCATARPAPTTDPPCATSTRKDLRAPPAVARTNALASARAYSLPENTAAAALTPLAFNLL